MTSSQAAGAPRGAPASLSFSYPIQTDHLANTEWATIGHLVLALLRTGVISPTKNPGFHRGFVWCAGGDLNPDGFYSASTSNPPLDVM